MQLTSSGGFLLFCNYHKQNQQKTYTINRWTKHTNLACDVESRPMPRAHIVNFVIHTFFALSAFTVPHPTCCTNFMSTAFWRIQNRYRFRWRCQIRLRYQLRCRCHSCVYTTNHWENKIQDNQNNCKSRGKHLLGV